MNIQFYNTPQPENLNEHMLSGEQPLFLSYEPNFAEMERFAEQYRDFKNLILIGNGGSLNSFFGFYFALKSRTTKKVYFLNTVDPDYIQELKHALDPKDTVVVSASKSGENTTQLESCMQFLDYPILLVTGEGSPIAQIAAKLGKTMMVHPPVGGRYAGFTEVALLPAALCGFDVRALYDGAQALYKSYQTDNLAWQAASVLWQLEQKNIVDVFTPVYSKHLAPFSQLIMQLCHESFGKDGKGQTYISFEGPEWQHHSSQRFYGGPKNVAGFFITLKTFGADITNEVPQAIKEIPVRIGTLGTLDGIPLSESMQSEIVGNLEDAKGRGIPLVHLELESRNPRTVGEFTAFWQLFAVYSSLIRGVNPFDQPEVESSKRISFERRSQLA